MPVSQTSISRLILLALIGVALVAASCGGKNSLDNPRLYGGNEAAARPIDTSDSDRIEETGTSSSPLAYASPANDASSSEAAATTADTSPTDAGDDRPTPAKTARKSGLGNYTVTPGSSGRDGVEALVYYGEVDNEDSASAVDDAVWRLLDLADEYHAMGVVANREASWEEAQYYFEKAVTIMAGLDIEADTIPTPEATKYQLLLDNVISDYRVTLRSLGQLQGDVTPSVLVERFGDLEPRLHDDSLVVYEKSERGITYDLPVKMNDRVKSSIIYFQTVAHDAFTKYLTRSKRYNAMFKEVLREYGVPEDLVYLSLVESGYNPKAYSWARASGLWQFIASTGRLYGLERNWWVDERRDPVKSTHAAARFLKDLYEQFGDWELAMAAYNGGPGRVRGTIKKQGTIDFWKMKLRRQTMDYVPLIYAAAIIAKDPERYGFHDIEHEPEIVWDNVTIDRCLDLKVIASALGCPVETLKELNPELLRNYTPPNDQNYQLKIPKGSRSKFQAAYASMPSPKETSWVKHEIQRGETVSTIAARYGVSQYAIMESNNLKRHSKIYAGKTLIVPVPLDSDYAASKKKNREYVAEGTVYSVKSGDTMWDIARAFGTSVDALRRVNYIGRGSRIYVGQKLKIPSDARNLKQLSQPSQRYASKNAETGTSGSVVAAGTHKVRAGDTLWDIARRYGTTTSHLRKLNGLGRSSRIYPGQALKVGGGDGSDFVTHKVRRGDSLSRIAKEYRTSTARILALNHLDDPDNIRVGQELKIKTR